jgi:hypothetical protein
VEADHLRADQVAGRQVSQAVEIPRRQLRNVLSSLETPWHPHIHLPMLRPEVFGRSPLSRLWPWRALVEALLPDLHKGVLARGVRAEIHDARPMVALCDDIVAVVAVVMVPVEGEVVAGGDFDGGGGLDVAHDVAAEVERVQVFDGGVGVAAGVRGGVVWGCTDAGEEALVDAVDEDALGI